MTDAQTIDRDIDAVEAAMTYTVRKPEKLVYRMTELGESEDSPDYHAWFEERDVLIADMRPVAGSLSLDREGFVLRQSRSDVADFYDAEEVKAVYDPEIERLVKQETGAEDVLVFDHTIRVASEAKRREKKVREPVKIAHIDFTAASGPQRVRDLLPADEAARRLESRFASYNLWRPITGPVVSMPLAVCDARSVPPEDLVITYLAYEDRVGENYNLAFNPDHRWSYVPRMTTDEITIFKSYESETDGRARFTPHSAFDDPTTPEGAPPRESIETRVLAFFAPEG